ncbi:hypothetical protein TVNIR_2975 [Thioalkalivibrio nitratireducens DSM 14787]|uniref:Uncharacterized protein n=1 Tax=Thioalkalivibrio nitratireducens (strain DSM 14787 / UNIQEM 213 / ALEN2) TaxID=1255043 RepID=L0E040_THIND|nr:DUF6064 family protein [Thioalkalivibrio nitratireducens]AGA34612.1 hypothetical protein TVNIR_2975 [Thioalkalivibrio nitratireducens DSM 14787]
MLPYSAEVLHALWGQYNHALWPLQIPLLVFTIAAIALARRRGGERASRAIGWVLVLGWSWTAIGYHWLYFTQIHFAAPTYAVLFAVQALLLGWSLALRGGCRFRLRADLSGIGALALVAWAIIGYPTADLLAAASWPEFRLVVAAPGPTALFTLGLLLLVEPRIPFHLVVIPLLWLAVDALSGWALGIPWDSLPMAAGLLAVALMVLKNRATLAARKT